MVRVQYTSLKEGFFILIYDRIRESRHTVLPVPVGISRIACPYIMTSAKPYIRIENPLELFHVLVLLRVDMRVRETHKEVVNEEPTHY